MPKAYFTSTQKDIDKRLKDFVGFYGVDCAQYDDSKFIEKSRILQQTQKYLMVRPFSIDKIYELNTFYDEIDKISEWPYTTSSIKKLVISIGTSIVPLILSFVGI